MSLGYMYVLIVYAVWVLSFNIKPRDILYQTFLSKQKKKKSKKKSWWSIRYYKILSNNFKCGFMVHQFLHGAKFVQKQFSGETLINQIFVYLAIDLEKKRSI